jgi:phosphate transport system substrate-binding protein
VNGRAACSLVAASAVLGACVGASPTSAAPGARALRASAADTVSISGSTVAFPLVADLAFYFRHAVHDPPAVSVVAGGTEAGIFDAARGVSDIGMVTRKRLASDPAELQFTPFARSAVCLVTNKANPVPNLTLPQVAQLVGGAPSRWADVTGVGDAAIVGASLVPGSGGAAVFLSEFVDYATPVTYVPRTFATPPQLAAFIEGTPNAWGYIDLSFASRLHVVPYEGVPCTREAVKGGTYRGIYNLSFVTRKPVAAATRRFIRWVRTSPTARKAIARRFVPIR